MSKELPVVDSICVHCNDIYTEGHTCKRPSDLDKLLEIPLSPYMQECVKRAVKSRKALDEMSTTYRLRKKENDK